MIQYSIVVPCYNEEDNIVNLVNKFDRVNEKLSDRGFELILVDNGSSDNTRSVIEACVEKHDYIKLVTVNKNQGYGYGILQGMAVSNGKYIGWIHADLQFSPLLFNDIADSIEAEENGRGVTTGLYYKGKRKNRPLFDRFFTFGMSLFESLYLRAPLWDINAQPTMMNRELFDKAINPPHGFILDLFFYFSAKKSHYTIHRFKSAQQERTGGVSSWNTGLKSKIRLIKTYLKDSKEMKVTHEELF